LAIHSEIAAPNNRNASEPVKRVLITGAAGFTGQHVGALLAQQGYEVHGVVHGGGGDALHRYSQVHEADLTEPSEIHRVLCEVRPQHVIHLAAIAFAAHDDASQIYRVNVVGSRNLLGAIVNSRPPVDSILLASSANIYGNATEGQIDENSVIAPVNDYGVSKVAMEYVASIFRNELPIIIVRPFNYTGRGQSGNFIIPKVIDHIRSASPIIELGNIEVARDFSDVRMVADAYARLLVAPAAIGETFNVCSERAISLREIIQLAEALSGHCLKIRVNPAFIRAHEVHTLRGSKRKIEAAIGPLKYIPFDDTLSWMLHA
jgi:nucleoside-diphosphate-sugar epimerase